MKLQLLITTATIATKMLLSQNFVNFTNIGNMNNVANGNEFFVSNQHVLYIQTSNDNIAPQLQQLIRNNINNPVSQLVQTQRNTDSQQPNKETNRRNLSKINTLSALDVFLIENISEPELQISQTKSPQQNKSSDKKSISLNIKTAELFFTNSSAKNKSSKTQISKKRKKKHGKLSKNRGIMSLKANYELCYKF